MIVAGRGNEEEREGKKRFDPKQRSSLWHPAEAAKEGKETGTKAAFS